MSTVFKPFEGETYREWEIYHFKKGGTYSQIVDSWIELEESKTPGQRMLVINQLKKPKDD